MPAGVPTMIFGLPPTLRLGLRGDGWLKTVCKVYTRRLRNTQATHPYGSSGLRNDDGWEMMLVDGFINNASGDHVNVESNRIAIIDVLNEFKTHNRYFEGEHGDAWVVWGEGGVGKGIVNGQEIRLSVNEPFQDQWSGRVWFFPVSS